MAEVVCRFCGARGRERADDPAPGVCPSCLDSRMRLATGALRDAAAAGREDLEEFARALLLEVGLTPGVAARFMRGAVRAAREALLTRRVLIAMVGNGLDDGSLSR